MISKAAEKTTNNCESESLFPQKDEWFLIQRGSSGSWNVVSAVLTVVLKMLKT